jgi:hypothetical protein
MPMFSKQQHSFSPDRMITTHGDTSHVDNRQGKKQESVSTRHSGVKRTGGHDVTVPVSGL